MVAESKYYLTGFYISLFLYAAVFFGIAHFIGSSTVFIQRYTSKNNFLDVILVDRARDITVTSQVKTNPKSGSGGTAGARVQTVGVQDIFKQVNTTKLTQTGATQSTPSRLNNKDAPLQNATKLLDDLNFKQQRTLTVTSSSTGIYDPFIGKIQDILDEKWQNTGFTVTGAEATVQISVDNVGHFSYSIVNLSYNNEFNLKLQEFLEAMKNENFPPFEGVGKFTMNIIFKDLME